MHTLLASRPNVVALTRRTWCERGFSVIFIPPFEAHVVVALISPLLSFAL